MNPTNSANIQSVLSQLRQYQAIAEGNNVENLNNKKVDNENGFAESIKNAVNEVNETQQASKKSLCLQETFPEALITLNKELLQKRLTNG